MSDARGPGDEAGDGGPDTDEGEGGADSGAPAEVVGGRPCPRCDRPMYHRHCKYVCPEHGVVYDCADTFY
jgi:hypothetical protein